MGLGKLRWAWALGFVLAVGCGGRGVAVQSPTTVLNARPGPQTEMAILDTLPKRGWTAESVQPGRILAFLSLRKHLLRVDIRYDPSQVNIYYVDSDNLSAHIEADGRVYAHRAVNNWIAVLARDISQALQAGPIPNAGPAYSQPPGNSPPAGTYPTATP